MHATGPMYFWSLKTNYIEVKKQDKEDCKKINKEDD
jgi:hypothetical protein